MILLMPLPLDKYNVEHVNWNPNVTNIITTALNAGTAIFNTFSSVPNIDNILGANI